MMNSNVKTILKIDSSALTDNSVTRKLGSELLETLQNKYPQAVVLERDVSKGLPFVDETWVGANFTPADQRSPEQRSRLELSDQLVDELRSADIVIIASPMYNFGIPASLKAYIDLIARAGETFRYTDNGPVGLLDDKQAFLVVASGGTPFGGAMDFVSSYLKHVLGFIGLNDVELVTAGPRPARAEAVS
jgi:FMN-dependent NADH-azoreductase